MKKLVSLVLALALVLGLCSFATAEGAAKKVGIAMPTQSLERWNRDGAYLKEQFEAAGYEVTCVVEGLGSLGEIQSLIVQHAQAAVDSLQ